MNGPQAVFVGFSGGGKQRSLLSKSKIQELLVAPNASGDESAGD